jgi:NTP pyrophosphatase (non-canonical NTP hydrolase)
MLVELPMKLVEDLLSRPDAFSENSGHNWGPLLHSAVGLASEAGELLDPIKKAWAYGHDLHLENIQEELGDILFYWMATCITAGLNPSTVVQANLSKLQKRYPSGKFSSLDALRRKDKE